MFEIIYSLLPQYIITKTVLFWRFKTIYIENKYHLFWRCNNLKYFFSLQHFKSLVFCVQVNLNLQDLLNWYHCKLHDSNTNSIVLFFYFRWGPCIGTKISVPNYFNSSKMDQTSIILPNICIWYFLFIILLII